METKRDALILKVSGSTVEGVVDVVASEIPITLVLNNEQLVTLLCTPSELEELAVGFLLSEGLLSDRSAIKKLEINEKDLTVSIEIPDLPMDRDKLFEKRTITSGCGKGITFTRAGISPHQRSNRRGPTVSLDAIRSLLRAFRSMSSLYLETGGAHSAALADGKNILFFSEDIGRHNAVDKLIGKAFLKDVPLRDKVLLTSGRVTSEIMGKAGRCGFPILISRAAPSCMAISAAEDMGITLVGFAEKYG